MHTKNDIMMCLGMPVEQRAGGTVIPSFRMESGTYSGQGGSRSDEEEVGGRMTVKELDRIDMRHASSQPNSRATSGFCSEADN